VGSPNRPCRSRPDLSFLWIATVLLAPRFAGAITVGGDVSYASAYIFRGITESDGNGAAQVDLHASTSAGTYLGVFVSTLSRVQGRGPHFELEEYLGHRFNLSQTWSAALTAVNYSYLDSNLPLSGDYQELSASLTYLDRWTLSVSAAPNAVRYVQHYRLGRYPAYVADLSGQLPLVGPLFATAGVGYYSLTGPEPGGYLYGNAGLAFEYKALRMEAGYYATQERAQELFPYGEASNRVAVTISWHF
jgi:uncharacterized protein (TIGR02001 family)